LGCDQGGKYISSKRVPSFMVIGEIFNYPAKFS